MEVDDFFDKAGIDVFDKTGIDAFFDETETGFFVDDAFFNEMAVETTFDELDLKIPFDETDVAGIGAGDAIVAEMADNNKRRREVGKSIFKNVRLDNAAQSSADNQ
jgi:hypothetical protein